MVIEATHELTWNIDTLVEDRGEAGVDELIRAARERAERLAEHNGKIADFDGSQLAQFMKEFGEIRELIGRAGSYVHLAFSTDTQDPAKGALLQKVQEEATAIT